VSKNLYLESGIQKKICILKVSLNDFLCFYSKTIRDEIIPQAVSLFTNEAAQEEDSSEDMDSDNEDEDEEKV
jgi:hypothetical protein